MATKKTTTSKASKAKTSKAKTPQKPAKASKPAKAKEAKARKNAKPEASQEDLNSFCDLLAETAAMATYFLDNPNQSETKRKAFEKKLERIAENKIDRQTGGAISKQIRMLAERGYASDGRKRSPLMQIRFSCRKNRDRLIQAHDLDDDYKQLIETKHGPQQATGHLTLENGKPAIQGA